MAEHPVIMENKQIKVFVRTPGQQNKESVVDSVPEVREGKKSFGQKLSAYAFGEEVANPGEYIWKSYLEPTGKRVANDIVEHFLLMVKHTFQRWIWKGKILDDGKWVDRTSFSNISRQPQQIQAMVMMSPVKELTFATLADANNVLNILKKDVQENGMTTVRDYYEYSGHPELCGDGSASSSGWRSLDGVEAKPNPDGGYTLSLKRPVSLSSNK
jgi:hypothetical protein